MDRDKAIRAAKLTAKQVSSHKAADRVADLLRQGRASEVTDDMMAQADPQRLHQHYTSGNTGVDMPMDEASRMQRARQMGFDTGNKLYHGTDRAFSAFDPKKFGEKDQGWYGRGVTTDTDPEVAEAYANYHEPEQGQNIIPTFSRGRHIDWPSANQPFGNPRESAQGTKDMQALGYSGSRMTNDRDLYGNTPDFGSEQVTFDPKDVRSQFARFDPRLSHLSHLNASTGGAMELARHATAVGRAGGQVSPSKYLPDVPRAVHADGGPAMFQGIHPDLQGEGGAPLDLYHGTTQDKEFEAFDDAKLGARDAGFYGRGHYLTPEKEIADSYTSSNDEYDFNGEPVKGAVIGPLHAALKNPYVWDVSDDMKSSKTLRDLQSMGIMRDKNELRSWDNLQSHHVRPFMAEMQKRGHDGVIVKTGHEHLPNGISEVVAFDPRSIKHKEAEVFDPTDPRIRRETGGEVEGRVSYGNGGKSLGLYSKAAQIIRSQPQAKGSVDHLLAMVSKTKGVKPAELTNAGRPAGDAMSKEELAKHFEDALPKVDVERIGGRDSNGFPQYEDYTLPGGENYREHLLHLAPQEGSIDKRRKELEDQYKNVSTVADLDRITSQINALSNDDEGANFKSSHWNTPNVLAHVRMSDRDNGKTLHVHEVQSDWGQEGREKGFHDPENPFEVVNKKTKEVVSRHPDYSSMWDAYRTHPDSDNLTYGDVRDEKPPQAPYVGNTQQWTDLALKHVLMEAAKGGHDRVVFSPGEANADMYGQRKEMGMLKFLKSKGSGEAGVIVGYSKDGRRLSPHKVDSHAEVEKLIGKENATNLLAQPQMPAPEKSDDSYIDTLQGPLQQGEDRYTHTLQGPLQVGGHGMVDYYKNYVNQGAMKLLQQHDPSIKPESYDLPNDYKGFALPMTDTARESILKNGFQAFKRGGEVHKATGGPVMGYVPMASLTVPRLAVARAPQYQQQQGGVGKFSDSLNSLMDTVEGFKKKPEADAAVESPSAASEGHPQLGMIAMPEEGYEATGMYAPFQSAIDRMISDAPGKITVASGYRTPERQEELWNEHAAKYPDPEVRDNYVARPGQSSHNYGLAADLSYADQEALKWAQENAPRYGLNFRMGHENWHIEPSNIWELRNAMTVPGYATGGRIGKDDGGAMFGHHNTSDKGVEVASNIGGIPMPSMAISKVAHPLESFGDVTLMAHPSMVTPSKDTNVWSADTYTGRQPRGEEEFSDPKSVRNAMRLDPDFGHMRDASSWIDSTNGVTDADEMMKTAQLGIARGVDPKEHTSFRDYVREVQKKLGSNVYDNDHMPGLRVYGDIKRVLYPKDMYTPSGKRKKPVDYTLDAVMRYMKGASEAGSENWNYGAGNFRAVNTPKFLSMSDVKADRGLIIPKGEMKPIKSEFEKSYNGLVEELVKARGQKGFRAYDEAAEALTDISKGRKVDWFGAVPPELVAQIKELGKHASKMPTEYFEAKSKKAIPLSAFPAALVSRDKPETARRLTEAGVKKVLTYGSPEERVAMYKSNPDLMFRRGGTVDAALAITRGFTKDGKSAINALKPKGK